MQSIKHHSLFSASDYDYLKTKGYTDNEIINIWNADKKAGNVKPLIIKKQINIIEYVFGN